MSLKSSMLHRCPCSACRERTQREETNSSSWSVTVDDLVDRANDTLDKAKQTADATLDSRLMIQARNSHSCLASLRIC